MWNGLLSRSVFSIGDRTYQWVDVVLHGLRDGQWSAFERSLAEGVAAEALAAAENAWPDDREVENAGTEFRYERELLAAADMTAWLGRVGLSLDDWYDFLRRRVMRAAWQSRLSAIVQEHPPAMTDLIDAAPAEGLCSGALMRMAESLAGCVAVAAGAATPSDRTPPPESAPGDPLAAGWLDWFPSWPSEDLRARARHLRGLAQRFDHLAHDAITPLALAVRLQDHHLDWVRVEVESLHCASESAAREVLLCVHDDGMSLSDAAAASGGRLTRGSFLLDDLFPVQRDAILSARCGDVLGPFATGGQVELVMAVSKHPATLGDPEVRRRAEVAVVAALVAAARAKVRWQVRP